MLPYFPIFSSYTLSALEYPSLIAAMIRSSSISTSVGSTMLSSSSMPLMIFFAFMYTTTASPADVPTISQSSKSSAVFSISSCIFCA